jgi:hypothetical protein
MSVKNVTACSALRKIQHHHLIQGGNASPKEDATISQKFMDNEECKNSWTRRNGKIF